VDQEAHSVEAPVSGRVIATYLELGQPVEKEDLLVELDSEETRFQWEEKRADQAGLSSQLERLQKEIQAQTDALQQARRAESSALDEAGARLQQAESAARLAEEEGARSIRMHEAGLVPAAERDRAEAEAQQRHAAAKALEQSLTRLEMDRRFEQSEKQAMVAELERKAAEIEAQLGAVEATLARLEHELEQHRVRAPTQGTIGEVTPLRVGSVLAAGDRVAVVVPAGDIMIVAEFDPPEALGRVRPGQVGRLRLQGFPWVQYGTVRATVARVANETQNGKIRVELEVEQSPDFPVSLQHGLPGTLEVEVERVSPAQLVLRTIGRAMARPAGDDSASR